MFSFSNLTCLLPPLHSWAQRRLKHLSWRSWWIILCTLDRGIPVSCEISQVDWCIFGLFSWLSTRFSTFSVFSSLRTVRGLLLPGCQTVIPVLRIYFNRLSMIPSFQEIHSLSRVHHIPLTDKDSWSESHLPVKFSWVYLFFLLIFRSRQFPKVKLH